MATEKQKVQNVFNEPLSDGKKTRPAGITSDEYLELIDLIRKKRSALSDELYKLKSSILALNARSKWEKNESAFIKYTVSEHVCFNELHDLIRDYFIKIPAKDKCFVDEEFIRMAYSNITGSTYTRADLNDQKTGCQICGENRGVDIAHIIPRTILKELQKVGHIEKNSGDGVRNQFVLCPNHHRFFDHGHLQKIEWESLDYSDKYPLSIDFMDKVFLKRQSTFWNGGKVSKGIADHCDIDSDSHVLWDWFREIGADWENIYK